MNRSCHSLQKERQEGIALATLFKRAIWAICSRLEQNEQITLFTFLNSRAIQSLWKKDSLFFVKKRAKLAWKTKVFMCSFKQQLRAIHASLLFSLFYKKVTRANYSYRSFKKSNSLFTKIAKRAIRSFKRSNLLFVVKKQMIRMKNQRANSQHCCWLKS